jgi:8-oxo-dGTP diphosphatase
MKFFSMPISDQSIHQVRYQVIPRTLVFLFDQHERVLLLEGSADKRLWAGKFNGIGGHIEPGEDIIEAAYRELAEETGIIDANLQFCAQIMVNVSDQVGVAIFVFKGGYDHKDIKPTKEGTFSWVGSEELNSLLLVEDLPVLLPKILAYQTPSPVLIGKSYYDKDGKLKLFFQ